MKNVKKNLAIFVVFLIMVSSCGINAFSLERAYTAQEAAELIIQAAAGGNINLYVAVNGNDDCTAIQSSPVATITRAKEIAREVKKLKSENQSVTVNVASGKYFINEAIEFTADDSDVAYIGAEGAILTGAKTITPSDWQTYKGDIKVADVEKNLKIDQLFVNSAQQILARYPNYSAGQQLQGCTSAANIKSRVSGYSNPIGGYIRAIHNNKWGGNSYRIVGVDSASATGLSLEWVGDNNRGSGYSTMMIENVLEEIDSAGEWYYDNAGGKLYYYPASNMNIETAVFEGAVNSEIFRFTGVKDIQQVNNITISGFTIENTKRTLFTGTYVPLMRSDWCVVRSGAIFMENAENIKIQNNTIRNIGGNAIFMSGHNANNIIDNNEIVNVGSSGVLIAGMPDSCREPSFWGDNPLPEVTPYYIHKTTIDDKTSGPKAEHYPKDIIVSNNHIKNVGIWEKQSSAVSMSVSLRVHVLHNTINLGPRAGINVCDGTFGGHEIAYNDVFGVQKETSDHGMFNSWGRDRFWSYKKYDTGGNYGADKEPYSRIDAIETIKIHDNRWYNDSTQSTFGIDLDDGSTNYEIYNNLCLNLGIKLREGFHRKVYNNIIVNAQFNLHCTMEDSYDEIYNNIIIKGTPYALAATNQGRFSASKDIINKNWFYDIGGTINYPSYWSALNYDTNSITTNPCFKNQQTNDYTVENLLSAENIGFINFDMNQFGKPGCTEKSPNYYKSKSDSGSADVILRENWLGASITAVYNEAIKSATGISTNNGVYIESVTEGTLADRFGLKSNDVITSVNDVDLGYKDTFLPIYNTIAVGSTVTFGIVRDQLNQEITFVKRSYKVIDNEDFRVKYTGSKWLFSIYSQSNCYNNTLANADLSKASDSNYAECSFEGNYIELISRTNNDEGNWKITITDSLGNIADQKTVSAYSSSLVDQVVIYNSPILTQGKYVLKVERITGNILLIDSFNFLGDDTVIPPENNIADKATSVYTSDCYWDSEKYDGSMALDNDDFGTKWIAAENASSGIIELTFNEPEKVNSSFIRQENSFLRYIISYCIEYYDGTGWKTAYTNTDFNSTYEETAVFDTVESNKIRLRIINGNLPSVYAFKLFYNEKANNMITADNVEKATDSLIVTLAEAKTFDRVVLSEEMITSYTPYKFSNDNFKISVLQNNSWNDVFEGTKIGDNRICDLSTAVTADKIKITFTKNELFFGMNSLTPVIQYLSVESIGNTKATPVNSLISFTADYTGKMISVPQDKLSASYEGISPRYEYKVGTDWKRGLPVACGSYQVRLVYDANDSYRGYTSEAVNVLVVEPSEPIVYPANTDFEAKDFSGSSLSGYAVENDMSADFTAFGGEFKSGDYLLYNNIDFGEGEYNNLMMMLSYASSENNKTIELRADSVSGTCISSFKLNNPSESNMFNNHYASVSSISGVHKLYIVFPQDIKVNIDFFIFSRPSLEKAERMKWWQEAGFGQFIHFGAYAQLGGHWNGKTYFYSEWIMEKLLISKKDYINNAVKPFNPDEFDAEKIVDLAKAAGQKYIVFTSRHHEGFSMFDTKVRTFKDYSLNSMGTYNGGDILKALSDECKKQGIHFGVYYSLLDFYDQSQYLSGSLFTTRLYGNLGSEYIYRMKAQLRELVMDYDAEVLFFDGEWPMWWTYQMGVDMEKYLRSLKPDIVINDRLLKRVENVGDYSTPEQSIVHSPNNYWETCMTLNNSWGYHKTDSDWKTAETVVQNLIKCRSQNGNFLLNVGPDEKGNVPIASANILREAGEWISAHSEIIYDTDPNKFINYSTNIYPTVKGNKVYLSLFNIPESKQINFPLMEESVISVKNFETKEDISFSASDDYQITIDLSGVTENEYATVIEVTTDGAPVQSPMAAGNVLKNFVPIVSEGNYSNPDYSVYRLNDGTTDSNNFVEASGNVNIVYDLKYKYLIKEMKLYARTGYNFRLANIKIYISEDNENFTFYAETPVSPTGIVTLNNGHITLGRYVKITNVNGATINISELEVSAEYAKKAIVTKITSPQWDRTSMTGEALYFDDMMEGEKTLDIILAAYSENNKLITMDCKTVTVNKNTVLSEVLTVSGYGRGAKYLRMYMWEHDTMKPALEPIYIEKPITLFY